MSNRRLLVLLLIMGVLILPALGGAAQDGTPEVTPPVEVTVEVTPEVTPEITPEVTDEATDEATAETTAETTAEVTTTATATVTTTATVTATVTPLATLSGPQPNTITGSTFVTEVRPFSEALMANLVLPAGFSISVVARDLGNARMIAVSDAGTIYISRRGTDDVIALTDANGDGVSDAFTVVASDIQLAHGLAIRDNRLYIAGEKRILVADIQPDGSLGALQVVTDGLPDGDQHGSRTIAFGPDGQLYVNLGSSCNACLESQPENATITRVPLDGSARTMVAQGLRNTLGFGWNPLTGQMWGMDHGSDWRGDDQPPEELNVIQEGGHYGWPFCYGNQQVDKFIPYTTEPVSGLSSEDFCATTIAPVMTYQAHSAPISMVFYTGGQFPADFANDAFVTMRGSWNRFPATGYKVVRIHFDANGQPTEFSDFVSGFLIEGGTANFGRLAGLTQAPDGSLLFTDDANGVLYRVSYTG